MNQENLLSLITKSLENPYYRINFRFISETHDFRGFLRENIKDVLKVIGRYEHDCDYERDGVLYSTYTFFSPLNLEPLGDNLNNWIGIPRYLIKKNISNIGLLSLFIHYKHDNINIYLARYNLRKERKAVKREKEFRRSKIRKRVRLPRIF